MPHIVIDAPQNSTFYLVLCGDDDALIRHIKDDIIVASSYADITPAHGKSTLGIPFEDDHTEGDGGDGGENSLDHILRDIIASRLLVVLYAPSLSINPQSMYQAMYQLGIARCLGKALLVLVESGRTLPSGATDMVNERDLFGFSREEVGTNELRQRLFEAIKRRTIPHRIVDDAYFPNIWASQRNNWLSGPDFFEGFMHASDTSLSATKLLQLMIHDQVDPLVRAVDEIISLGRFSTDISDVNAYVDRRNHDCLEMWEVYVAEYDNQYRTAIDQIRLSLDTVVPSDFSLMEKLCISPASSDLLRKCGKFRGDLARGLRQYTRYHEVAETFIGEGQGIVASLCNARDRSTLYGKLLDLSTNGKKTMIKAVALNGYLLRLSADTSA